MNKRTRNLWNRRTCTLIAFTAILTAAAVAWARAGKTVLYHGAVVSSNVSVINGNPYVPLADMARTLGGKVVAHGDGYEIVSASGSSNDASARTAPGGANEVRGQDGKVGDWFFNGYWRFQVKSVERMSEYKYHFAASSGTEKPSGDNDELVVLTCQIKNGHQEAEQPILTKYGTSAQKTALTDDQGQSYAPVDFDVRDGSLVPGAAKSFAVVFSVPKGTKLQSMIFTLYGYGETSTKASNVRVALSP